LGQNLVKEKGAGTGGKGEMNWKGKKLQRQGGGIRKKLGGRAWAEDCGKTRVRIEGGLISGGEENSFNARGGGGEKKDTKLTGRKVIKKKMEGKP